MTLKVLSRIGMWMTSIVFKMTYFRRVSLMGSLFITMSLVIGLCVPEFLDPCPLIKSNRKEGDYSSPEGNVHIVPAFLGS